MSTRCRPVIARRLRFSRAAGAAFRAGCVFAIVLAACSDPPVEVAIDTVAVELPFSEKPGDVGPGADSLGAPADAEPPVVTIRAPTDGAALTSARVSLRGETSDDVGVVAVSVKVGHNAAFWLPSEQDLRSFDLDIDVPLGQTPLVVTAYDAAGRDRSATVTVSRKIATPDTQAPTVEIEAPADLSVLPTDRVVVTGRATDNAGLTRVELRWGSSAPVVVETGDQFAHWQAALSLPAGQTVPLTATAFDSAGLSATHTITVTVGPQDAVPPTVAITAPLDGATLAERLVTLTGTAADDRKLAKVEVRVGAGPFVPALSTDGFATWSLPAELRPGANLVKAIASDSAGNTGVFVATLVYATGDYSAPRLYTLGWQPPTHTPVTLTLDKAQVAQAIPPAEQEAIVLLNLDPTPMLVGAIEYLRGACGPDFSAPGFVPACPAAWGTAEMNMWRLLTMTPATADVTNTSFATMAAVVDWLASGTLEGWPDIKTLGDVLSPALGVAPGDPLIATDTVVASIRRNLIGTHPAAPGAVMPITLRDGLTDMASLATKFGPAGVHPGFIPPGGASHSEVLEDDFALIVGGTSNLHWHDGLALATGKAKLAFVAAGAQDVLDLDFLSPDTFQIKGLAASPTVDLDFAMVEHPGLLTQDAGLPIEPCVGATPFVGPAKPWTIEMVVDCAAKLQFVDYTAGCDLCPVGDPAALLWGVYVPSIPLAIDLFEIAIGTQGVISKSGTKSKHFDELGTPEPGRMWLWTDQGAGFPPEFQAQGDDEDLWDVGTLWNLISEIAQQRLRDGGVAEGAGDVKFRLDDIPVGLSAEELIAAMRPSMEAQKSFLTDVMLGDYAANADAPDLFLVQTDADSPANAALWLVHVQPGDPARQTFKGLDFPYTKDGFYGDAALTAPAGTSLNQPPLASDHPALRVTAEAQRVYVQGQGGSVHRLDVRGLADGQVEVVEQTWLGGTP
jgi:hypothetical protein